MAIALAAQFGLSPACFLITYPLSCWVGVAFGLEMALTVMCAIFIASMVFARLLWPIHDPLELEHTHMHFHDGQHEHEHEGWEGAEPHNHLRHHQPLQHRHALVIDSHHPDWPR